MKIIFGTGAWGREISQLIRGTSQEDIAFYSNHTSQWGTAIDGVRVLNYEEFIEAISKGQAKIINAAGHYETSSPSGLYFLCFLKDAMRADGIELSVYELNESGEFDLLNLDDITPPSMRNLEDIEAQRKEVYLKKLESLKEKGGRPFQHLEQYIKRMEQYHAFPEIIGLELTNYCNLACKNCGTPTSKRKRGFMSDEVFQEALKYVPIRDDLYFSIFGVGECLLHPRFFDYLGELIDIGSQIHVSSNGCLLNSELIEKIISYLNKTPSSKVTISLHTEQSVKVLLEFINILKGKPSPIILNGNVLDYHTEEVYSWIERNGSTPSAIENHLTHVHTHSWAGNVQGAKVRLPEPQALAHIRTCNWLNGNWGEIKWDGRISGCCLDVEGHCELGSVFHPEKVKANTQRWNICSYCR